MEEVPVVIESVIPPPAPFSIMTKEKQLKQILKLT